MPTTVKRETQIVDAADQPLGRVASRVAHLLRGKHKTSWVADRDSGDAVQVINVDKMVFTGNKVEKKVYRHHTGRPGGLKEATLGQQLRKGKKGTAWVLRTAVKGMLPTNSFRNEALKRLTFGKQE
ncbi:MAG: 50S ribosomal protein L13 [Parcubacteria group bacterium]|nr:50S ribosomal protein L13 [Parcubacteria group bacterium]